ncbi:hypothetical protein [Methanobrevibacter curvatus]|uniref:Uncharacterized protein n=1 Tax=Methanobrevibacter curvatus TaxID=49547 RepID=A0A165YWZ6_9EURY|nr:hypothetical protein [Methanobrevibacter curvatus]KZX09966.1 hypothetical protein MBCUR_19830 [Methanobrevibacter curvatus]
MGPFFVLFLLIGGILGLIVYYVEDNLLFKLESLFNIKIKRQKCKNMNCYTYLGLSIIGLIVVLIIWICMLYPLVYVSKNFPVFIGFFFIFVFPLIVTIVRKNTFHENTIVAEKNPQNMLEKCTGYNPIWYFLMALMVGGSSTVWGFSMLNFSHIPSTSGLIVVISGLISQMIILSPDLINKIVPFDLRTFKGLKIMFILAIALSIILTVIRGLVA